MNADEALGPIRALKARLIDELAARKLHVESLVIDPAHPARPGAPDMIVAVVRVDPDEMASDAEAAATLEQFQSIVDGDAAAMKAEFTMAELNDITRRLSAGNDLLDGFGPDPDPTAE